VEKFDLQVRMFVEEMIDTAAEHWPADGSAASSEVAGNGAAEGLGALVLTRTPGRGNGGTIIRGKMYSPAFVGSIEIKLLTRVRVHLSAKRTPPIDARTTLLGLL
jgi:hypothetical protein